MRSRPIQCQHAVLDEIVPGYCTGPITFCGAPTARRCLLAAQINRSLALPATGLRLLREALVAATCCHDCRGGYISSAIEQTWSPVLYSLHQQLHGHESENILTAQAHEC